MNDSIDYKSVDEEIAKSNTQWKTEISAGDILEKDNSNGGDESTITASKITDIDDEKSVTIQASTCTDGSTLVDKTDFPLPQFFQDDISTENNSSMSGEKNDRKGITDNTTNDGKGEKIKEITDKKKTDPAAVPTVVISGESKETKVHMEDKKEHSESENENDKEDGKLEVESEGRTSSQNYDLSVKSPTIDPNDSEDSEDNDDPLSLSEIPTSQLDTTVQNSFDEDNENVEENSNENSMVDEKKDKEDTGSQSKKKKRLGITGAVKNVKSKKLKKITQES